MKRRDFLTVASGVAGGAAAAGAATPAGATPETTTAGDGETTTAGGGDGTTTTGGGTTTAGPAEPDQEVIVGPGGELVYEPADLTIAPGTTVEFVWDSDNHNIVVDSQPEGADWQGTPGSDTTTYDTGYTYTHTFETTGTYDYYCQPHLAAGMEASITVEEGGGGGGGGVREVSPEEMGVPFRAHYVGIAAMLAIVLSILFAFFQLKYAESPNTSSPNRER